jgi:hypothetical protein
MTSTTGLAEKKPSKPPNHSRGTKRLPTGQSRLIFREALIQRQTKCPFDRISAYKIRECRESLMHEQIVVHSITEYLRAPKAARHASMLVGCVEEDKAYRLKRIPNNIVWELGYNLVPAIAALPLEGVAEPEVRDLLNRIKPQIDRLLRHCDATQAATRGSVRPEYQAMMCGGSATQRICAHAVEIANRAAAFCQQHGCFDTLQ